MRQSFGTKAILLFYIFLIISSSAISARLLQHKQGQEEKNLKEITDGDSILELEGSDMMNLMGFEVCVDGDEDCVKRRVLAEAHLDYIYTQQHKP